MIFITFFIGLALFLIFLFFRGSNRVINPATQMNPTASNPHKDRYTAIKSHLEKAFAKKREEKPKYFSLFIEKK